MPTTKTVYIVGNTPFLIRGNYKKEIQAELLGTLFPDGKPLASLDEAAARCRSFADHYRHLPEMAEVVRVMDDLPAALEAASRKEVSENKTA
jgi:hypothetical protein